MVRGLSNFNGPVRSAHEAATATLLYNFQGGNSDGGYPYSTLIGGPAGRLYGTTNGGGPSDDGTVFELKRTGPGYAERSLYAFQGGTDGELPYGNLVLASNGTLYGTTYSGGAIGSGCIFALTPSGNHYAESVIYSFKGSPGDGGNPYAGLSVDASGTLYGTTLYGGTFGAGTVFSLKPTASGYVETVLYSFSGASDGATPYGGVLPAGDGNLYGTSTYGGAEQDGVVYSLTPVNGGYAENVLHNFTGGSDGAHPVGTLVESKKGDVFGTTLDGGKGSAGTVFRVDTASKPYVESVLYAFTGGGDGGTPYGNLVLGDHDKLYGTTSSGGTGAGTVFELAKVRQGFAETVLATFSGFPQEATPYAGLFARDGILYGTTFGGGFDGYGTVFSISGH
jgi:uncharacterized repeat protein (TIGR03803 family)